MSKPSFFVCGLVRDVGRKFPLNHRIISRWLDENSSKTHWFFYENDSRDNTVQLLQRCAQDNPNFQFETEVLGARKWGPIVNKDRARYMCRCRNKYLQRLVDLGHDFDYMLVVDMDLSRVDAQPISIAMTYDADMVGANGRVNHRNKDSKYYDAWALQGYDRGKANELTEQSPRAKVTSCFGGMGLYKVSSVEGHWYDPQTDNIQYADHGSLHESMRNAGHNDMWICPPWIVWL